MADPRKIQPCVCGGAIVVEGNGDTRIEHEQGCQEVQLRLIRNTILQCFGNKFEKESPLEMVKLLCREHLESGRVIGVCSLDAHTTPEQLFK